MRIAKVTSVLAMVLLASQSICGYYISQNPEAAASGSADFHLTLGIITLIVTLAATVSFFRAARKTA
ncbi:MAG: hypothetical protein JXA46_11545 [Dehalococcoidales bacterium]|nr:hypothetical protein [Dehalococcoidales bacterium]